MADDGSEARALGWGLAAFAAIFILVGLDLLGDYGSGIALAHLLIELSVMTVSATAVAYLVLRFREARSTVRGLSREVQAAREEGERWRREAADLLTKLSAAVARQFDRWELTTAERHVALGLLRGRSHKEIARERHTSERTVRQQAQMVYQKGGLGGRSELAAFFLEGLLGT